MSTQMEPGSAPAVHEEMPEEPPTIPMRVLAEAIDAVGAPPESSLGSVPDQRAGTTPHCLPGGEVAPREPKALGAAVARKSDKDKDGIAAQLTKCSQQAAAEGVYIPDDEAFHFIDDATSGVKTDRKGLKRLYALLMGEAAVPFKYLYIKDRSRLARSEDPRWIFWFEIHCLLRGVIVRYTDEPAPPLGSDGTPKPPREQFLLQAVKNFFTSEERGATLRRTRGGRRARIRNGFWPLGSAPYGTIRYLADLATGVLVCPVPHNHTIRRDGHAYKLQWATNGEVETIQRIFKWLDAGWSFRKCAKTLNAEGVQSPAAARARPGKTAGGWTAEGIRNIANEPLYKGEAWYGRTSSSTAPARLANEAAEDDPGAIRSPEFMSNPPISAELWDRVNTAVHHLPAAFKGRKSDRYLLSDVARCAHCGRKLIGQAAVRRDGSHQVVAYRYYTHLRHDPEAGLRTQCPHAGRVARADLLEDQTEAAIAALVRDPTLGKVVADRCAQLLDHEAEGALRREFRQAEAHLAECNRERDVLRERYASLQANEAQEDFRVRYEAKCVEAKSAQQRLLSIASRAKELNSIRARFASEGLRAARDAEAILASSSRDDRRQLYRVIIESLLVDFEHNRATLNLFALDPAT